jgi:hypothetical protein
MRISKTSTTQKYSETSTSSRTRKETMQMSFKIANLFPSVRRVEDTESKTVPVLPLTHSCLFSRSRDRKSCQRCRRIHNVCISIITTVLGKGYVTTNGMWSSSGQGSYTGRRRRENWHEEDQVYTYYQLQYRRSDKYVDAVKDHTLTCSCLSASTIQIAW